MAKHHEQAHLAHSGTAQKDEETVLMTVPCLQMEASMAGVCGSTQVHVWRSCSLLRMNPHSYNIV